MILPFPVRAPVKFGNLCSRSICTLTLFFFQGMILMGPLVIVDPDLATPVKKWLAKVLQGILPGFCLGGIDPALVTRDREYVRKV